MAGFDFKNLVSMFTGGNKDQTQNNSNYQNSWNQLFGTTISNSNLPNLSTANSRNSNTQGVIQTILNTGIQGISAHNPWLGFIASAGTSFVLNKSQVKALEDNFKRQEETLQKAELENQKNSEKNEKLRDTISQQKVDLMKKELENQTVVNTLKQTTAEINDINSALTQSNTQMENQLVQGNNTIDENNGQMVQQINDVNNIAQNQNDELKNMISQAEGNSQGDIESATPENTNNSENKKTNKKDNEIVKELNKKNQKKKTSGKQKNGFSV